MNTLPESSSWVLVGIGLASLAGIRRRKLPLCQVINRGTPGNA
ncbi:PEP-CTERM sorting domain-containing protein [Nitrosovibrio tenuis]